MKTKTQLSSRFADWPTVGHVTEVRGKDEMGNTIAVVDIPAISPPEPDWREIVKEIEREVCFRRKGIGWLECDEEVQHDLRLQLEQIIRAGCGYPRAG